MIGIFVIVAALIYYFFVYSKKENFESPTSVSKKMSENNIENNTLNQNIGFIMLRHVRDETTNKYWNHSYDCIRKYYPEYPIMIIDDNSNYEFINERNLYKTTIIKSEYPGRGELLPYYYYLQHKLFDTAIIIHDSVFVNKHIDFTVDKYKIMWSFQHHCDQIEDETKMINLFNDSELSHFHKNKHLWDGCFGCMSVITHDYLMEINHKYNINKLLDHVLNRYNRCSFERVVACLLQIDGGKKETFFGNIYQYCKWDIKFHQKDEYKHLPIIKVWSGR
jgi:hypothetical protein